MQFQTMGTVSNYVRMMKLDMKFQKRKQNSWLDKEDEDPGIRQLKEQAEQTRKSNTLQSIMGKVKAGIRLSSAEIEYLRENCPDAYRQVLEIEKERAEYRRELERCRTKEDVRKLNQRKMTQFQAEAKSVASNPNIPQGEKTALLEKIQMRIANIQNEHCEFTNTPEYKALPKDERELEDKREQNGANRPGGGKGVEDLLKDVKLRDSDKGFDGVPGSGSEAVMNEAATAAQAKTAGGKPREQGSKPAEKAPAFHAGRAYDSSGNPARARTGTAHTVSVKV